MIRAIAQFFRWTFGAWTRFQNDDGLLMAAAVAYYSALAFFPLMLILTSLVGVFLNFTAAGYQAERQVLRAIEETFSEQMRAQVERVVAAVGDQAGVGGPVGFVMLLVAATILFAQFDRAFERIWNVPTPQSGGVLKALRRVVVLRLRAFLLLLAVGALVLAVFIASMVLNGLQTFAADWLPGFGWVWRIVQIVVTILLNTLAFLLLYRVLPRVEVRWREALAGAAFAAVTWEIGRQILAIYLVGGRHTAYGVIGSFIAVMLWVFYANAVIFLGAEFVQEVCHECDGDRPLKKPDKLKFD